MYTSIYLYIYLNVFSPSQGEVGNFSHSLQFCSQLDAETRMAETCMTATESNFQLGSASQSLPLIVVLQHMCRDRAIASWVLLLLITLQARYVSGLDRILTPGHACNRETLRFGSESIRYSDRLQPCLNTWAANDVRARICRYSLQDLKPDTGYEVRVSYPATVGVVQPSAALCLCGTYVARDCFRCQAK